MILGEWWACLLATLRYRDYVPQPVTQKRFMGWLRQHGKRDRAHLLKLLQSVVYVSEEDTKRALLDLNRALLQRLKDAGIPPNKVIYVQVHDAGSSSPVMLNTLRDLGHLERLGCRFMDSNNVLGLNKLTNELEEGALIYVDDFAGTGDQFCRQRKFIAEHLVGNFTEFFLLPAICEEAIHQLGGIGVEPVAKILHGKADRPLHPNSSLIPNATRERLIELCNEIDPENGLGYQGIAAMVVLYRNAPNTLPTVLRGSLDQMPRVGLFPRYSDLPMVAPSGLIV